MRIDIADVRNVVTHLLHPKRQRKFPQQELTRALRKRRVKDLAVLAVRPVPTDENAGADVPIVRRGAVVVDGEEMWPVIVNLQRGYAAMKDDRPRPHIREL